MDLFLIHSKPNQTSGPLQPGMCKMSCTVFPDIERVFPRFAFVPITFCPSSAQAVLLRGQLPLQCPVPQQLLLCMALVTTDKNMPPEEQDSHSGCHRAVGLSQCCVRGAAWCPGLLEGADTSVRIPSSRGVLTMSLPHWQLRVPLLMLTVMKIPVQLTSGFNLVFTF